MEDEGDVARLREAGGSAAFGEQPRREFEDGDAEFGRDSARRRVEAFLDDQEPGPEVFEVEGEFGAAVAGVERGADGGAGDAEEGDGHFGAVGEDHGDPIGAGDSGGAEALDDGPYLAYQLGVRERGPAEGMDRGGVRWSSKELRNGLDSHIPL